jgi:selenocysteine lyase/cysteine desulfurase
MLTTARALVTDETYFANLRAREFSRLDREGLAYLDYTGAALYGERQVRQHAALLARSVFGNPHSEHRPSRHSTQVLEQARQSVLDFLDAAPDEYDVCFTANASAAIKLVAESYPFGSETLFALSADNHNSVNGVREYARRSGAHVRVLPIDRDLKLDDPDARLTEAARGRYGGLLAFPAQSNFSGIRHSLSLVRRAHDLGLDVLLDAASLFASGSLSLRDVPADFVALSFYKIFGYPTGVGALVARRLALEKLRRPWFAGGTVDFVSVQGDAHQLRSSAESFADGTPNFLAVSAIPSGFAFLADIGRERVARHAHGLACTLTAELLALRHANGHPVVTVYGPANSEPKGSTVVFNVLTAEGRPVRYQLVEDAAQHDGVAIRGGCFCNPGASEAAFGFDAERSATCLRSLPGRAFSVERFQSCMGSATAVGAVRASLGAANVRADVDRLLTLVTSMAA